MPSTKRKQLKYQSLCRYLGLKEPVTTAFLMPQKRFNRSAFPCTCTLVTDVPLILRFSGSPREVGMTYVSSRKRTLLVKVLSTPRDNIRSKSIRSARGISSSSSHSRSFKVNRSKSLPNSFRDSKPLGVIVRRFTFEVNKAKVISAGKLQLTLED